jgi:hypothetical protein
MTGHLGDPPRPDPRHPVVLWLSGLRLPERAVLRAAVLGAPVPKTCWRFHHWRVLVASVRVKRRHQGQAGPYLPFANAYLFVRAVWLYAVYAVPWGEPGSLVYSVCRGVGIRTCVTYPHAPSADPCQRGKATEVGVSARE